jgi:hypothetical protein
MGYGEIIKRAWRITWRFRALWVLGLFAGVTGGSGGGGSARSNYSPGSGSNSDLSSSLSDLHPERFLTAAEKFIPILVVGFIVLFLVGLVWWVLSIAARGGLVYAVNEIESGRPFTLGQSWNAGFARFWTLLGLSILLMLPVFVVGLFVFLGVTIPILIPLLRGSTPNAASIAPMCGVLAIGVPLLIVMSIVLGVMYILAVRFVMLDGKGAVESAAESWRSIRGRFKDNALMYLVSLGLNIAAGIVLAIPMVILILALVFPAVAAGVAGNWTGVAAAIAVMVLLIFVLSFAFTAVWGTFTSSLWTIFFRRMTGMEPPPAAAEPTMPPAPAPPAPAPLAPPPPPPAPPAPAAPPLASPPSPPAAPVTPADA